MRTLRAEIPIDAPAETVWAVLTDFAAYPEWNPFIRSIEGSAEPGARLTFRIAPPGGREMTLRPTVLAAREPHELRWLGRLGLPRIFDGEHRFDITEDDDGRVQVVQSEQFRGVLVPFVPSVLRRTLEGFEQMNAALKVRAEAHPSTVAEATRAATSTGSHTGENGGA
jgi:hypothetical protein